MLCLFLLLSIALAEVKSSEQENNPDIVLNRELPPKNQKVLDELIQYSIERKSAYKPLWLNMIYYQRSFFGYHSRAKGDFFFRSDKGKHDPQAELEATLRDLLYPIEWIEDKNLHPQCHFPARYEWLKKELDINTEDFPQVSCDLFLEWKRDIGTQGVSLAFANYYSQHPASLFGHTFLVFHSKDDLYTLDKTFEFGLAIPENANAFQMSSMIFRGLFGLYIGQFQMNPYYKLQKKYLWNEARDIWMYNLNLTPEEIDLLSNHLWELGAGVNFSYSFMRNNCSFQILKLFNVVLPDHRLSDNFSPLSLSLGTVLPLDTIRVFDRNNKIKDMKADFSTATKYTQNLDNLSEDEKEILYAVIKNLDFMDSETFQNLPEERKVFILDTLLEFYKFRAVEKKEDSQKKYKIILEHRKALSLDSPMKNYSVGTNPLQSHRAGRFDLTFGQHQQGKYIGMRHRLNMHELVDPTVGFAPNSQLLTMALEAEYNIDTNKLSLTEFTLFDIFRAPLNNNGLRTQAFHYHTALQRNNRSTNSDYTLDIGIAKGLSQAIFQTGLTTYFLPSGIIALSPHEKYFADLGVGSELGIIWDKNPYFSLIVGGDYHYYLSLSRAYYSVDGNINFFPSQNMSVGLQGEWDNTTNLSLSTHIRYFY